MKTQRFSAVGVLFLAVLSVALIYNVAQTQDASTALGGCAQTAAETCQPLFPDVSLDSVQMTDDRFRELLATSVCAQKNAKKQRKAAAKARKRLNTARRGVPAVLRPFFTALRDEATAIQRNVASVCGDGSQYTALF